MQFYKFTCPSQWPGSWDIDTLPILDQLVATENIYDAVEDVEMNEEEGKAGDTNDGKAKGKKGDDAKKKKDEGREPSS